MFFFDALVCAGTSQRLAQFARILGAVDELEGCRSSTILVPGALLMDVIEQRAGERRRRPRLPLRRAVGSSSL